MFSSWFPSFLPDVNFAARKLIDHLVAAEKRHRVAGCEIENRAPQFLLGRGRDLHVEPKTNDGANRSDDRERNADARDADAVRAERDQFVVGGEAAEDEQDRGEQAPGNGEDERERQDVGDEGDEVFRGHVVIDEQRQKLAKNVARRPGPRLSTATAKSRFAISSRLMKRSISFIAASVSAVRVE